MLSTNQTLDSLSASDRSLLMPASNAQRAAKSPLPPPQTTVAMPELHGVGLNPLIRAATPLLNLASSLRQTAGQVDVMQLRIKLVVAVRQFEAAAKAALVPHEEIAVARYCLCTLLDESIASTPCGSSGIWANRSLLVIFHHEASGGEKFFLLLQKLAQDPATHLITLELMYLCLALGLEGRYRVMENGRSQLDELRERLLLLIQKQRSNVESELSPHWVGAAVKGDSLWSVIPVWIIAVAVLVFLMGLQWILDSMLNHAAEPVYTAMHHITVAQQNAAPVDITPPVPVDRVASFLEPEIAQHLVTVTDTADLSVITLTGDGMFASGSAEVNPKFVPLLERIAEAIKPLSGQVLVVGHTDNVQGKVSSHFNFTLSEARANSVKNILADRAGPPDRYRAEGRGDADPLVPNDSAANRARNRRVDIIVMKPGLSNQGEHGEHGSAGVYSQTGAAL